MRISKTKTITAQNTFTPWVPLAGTFNVLILGMIGSTVTLQGSIDGGVTPYDIISWTGAANATKHIGNLGASTDVYRIGVKTGNYGGESGGITIKLEA